MAEWVIYAVGAAILYGLHQIFTKLASDRIGEGVGGFVVEATAALTILIYLIVLKMGGGSKQAWSAAGFWWSVATGVCVGAGTILFFLLFQRGGPLSAAPVVLAVGAAIMGGAGILLFKEPASVSRMLGIGLAIVSLFLLRK